MLFGILIFCDDGSYYLGRIHATNPITRDNIYQAILGIVVWDDEDVICDGRNVIIWSFGDH